ncbi:MAG: glycosyltransferase family 4 protein, partial [bacterium]
MTSTSSVKRSKLLFILESFEYGGAEIHAVRLACALKSRGFASAFLALEKGGPLEDQLRASGIKTEVLALSRMGVVGTGWRLLKRLSRPDHDVAVVVDHHRFPFLAALGSSHGPGRRPAVFICHSFPSRQQFARLGLRQLTATMLNRSFHRQVFISPRQRDHFLKTLRLPLRRTTVIANGVNTDRFRP